jgi:hypothetical protein
MTEKETLLRVRSLHSGIVSACGVLGREIESCQGIGGWL